MAKIFETDNFFGLCFLKQKNWEKHCFPADTNSKRSGLSPTQELIPFPTVSLTMLPLAAICHLFLLQRVKRSLTLAGVQQGAEASQPIRSHPCPVTSASQHPLWWAPANCSAPANTCFKDTVHVPLFNTARLLHPSKSWITSEVGELPQDPWDKLAWHQAPAGLSSSYCHCHLGTFPLATKVLGPCRTTIVTGDFCNWAAQDLNKPTYSSGLCNTAVCNSDI